MNALYAAFDIFPTAKGAAAHIASTVEAVSAFSRRVTLACLGAADMPAYQEEGNIDIRRCRFVHPNFLRRTEVYADFLWDVAGDAAPDIVHFRDIWSGMPLLAHPALKGAKKIFEVNSLPSLELPCHYPAVADAPALMRKLEMMENDCLDKADAVITVSGVTAGYLVSRGVDLKKIAVIPNTARRPKNPSEVASEALAASSGRVVLYAGTLSPWQGVEVFLDALSMIRREGIVPVIAASNRKYLKGVFRKIDALGLGESVQVLVGLSPERMNDLYARAAVSVTPLLRGLRNELQGACPVKVIESMAAGVPVIASDLPCIRELVRHEGEGLLAVPDSPRALAAALVRILGDEALRLRLAENARAGFARSFGNNVFSGKLRSLYECVGG
jgi:glycosyltransferase involved in cell wall biosynthesis